MRQRFLRSPELQLVSTNCPRQVQPRRWRRIAGCVVAALCARVCWLPCNAARAAGDGAVDAAQFQADLTALASDPTRVPGTDGYYHAASYLQRQFAALGNAIEWKTQAYPLVAPFASGAEITLANGERDKIYPFWPAVIRPNATPPAGITGRLLYVGDATLARLRPADLRGQVAIIEASAGDRWRDAFALGARAALILGTDDTTNVDLRGHELKTPVDFPRFYVPPGPLAQGLRGGRWPGAALHAAANWRRTTGLNFYVYVKPTRAAPADWPSSISPPAALCFSIPFDSSSLVPGLAPGAGQAVQAAAGLALLRDFARHPLDRPVLFAFTGADTIQFAGTRQMMMALADVPRSWQPELATLVSQASNLSADVRRLNELQADPSRLDLARSADRRAADRVVTLIETDASVEQDELFHLRLTPQDQLTPPQVGRLADLQSRQAVLSTLRYGFRDKPATLASPAFAELARTYVHRAMTRAAGEADGGVADESNVGLAQQIGWRQDQLRDRIALFQWLARLEGRNDNPEVNASDSRLIELLVGLDLSEAGRAVGPAFWGSAYKASVIGQVQTYADWFERRKRLVADGLANVPWVSRTAGVLDLSPFDNARSPAGPLCAAIPLASEPCQAWGIPAFTMATLDDLRLRRDTPADDLAHLPPATIAQSILPQLDAVRQMFRAAWSDSAFRDRVEPRFDRGRLDGQAVSFAPGQPAPNLPRQGFFATYYYAADTASPQAPRLRELSYCVGMRRNEVAGTDVEGHYLFEGIPRFPGDQQLLAAMVYRLSPGAGQITATTDFGQAADGISNFVNITQSNNPVHSLVFDCAEFSLLGLYDPRYLQTLGDLTMLDAARNAEPQRFGAMVGDQMLAGFIEPATRAMLLLRYGRVGNRLMLLNIHPADAGQGPGEGARGFSVSELNDLGPIAVRTTEDFHTLDGVRLEGYRRAGVSSDVINALHAAAAKQLDDAKQALAANDGPALVKNANGAWADEARVYQAAQDMARDVIRAAVFLLLLCVPFSFCMERLLIATPNVYKQIIGMCAIFAIMTAALWSFHPAFRISASPLIIILAFAIIFMSIVVIAVIYGKFDTELKRIRSGRGDAEGVSFSRASVLGSAIILGISNMRRRRFRTFLTSATIVLITFAVLCFTSATRYVGSSALPTGVETSYPGVMLRQRGFRPMPTILPDSLAAVLGPAQPIAQRWWNVDPADPTNTIDIFTRPNKPGEAANCVAVQAMLGLTPAEWDNTPGLNNVDGLSGAAADALRQGRQDVIYLPRAIASELGVAAGAAVQVGGLSLHVAGVFDGEAFDRNALMLSGESLAPLKYTSGALDAGGHGLDSSNEEDLELSGSSAAGEAAAGQYDHLSASHIAIVPAPVSQMLPNASLRSIAIRVNNGAAVKAVTDDLARRYAVALFGGFDDGVKLVAASELATVKGGAAVAVPLAIAGLIVFNTMMGSIAERRREIHIYTSLGLAPMHVGALFVAEAMTYGLIGTVFGYIIGQGVGTALLKLGWLGGVTLNYSGTSAMLTMGLILVIVLLSALVPARIASQIAAPSVDRTWTVPVPRNGLIEAVLPFTINKTAADGALAYLAEFFAAHQEGSIGKFSAGRVEALLAPPSDGESSGQAAGHGVRTIIWLTPFDLGVRQQLTLLIRPGEYPDIYEVLVRLRRLSGDDRSWYRMNRPFLVELRRQFLRWRSLSPQRMLQFVEESRRLFASAPPAATERGAVTVA